MIRINLAVRFDKLSTPSAPGKLAKMPRKAYSFKYLAQRGSHKRRVKSALQESRMRVDLRVEARWDLRALRVL